MAEMHYFICKKKDATWWMFLRNAYILIILEIMYHSIAS